MCLRGFSGASRQMIATTSEFILFFLLLIKESDLVNGIGCFTCTSINGSDPNCADPFNSAFSKFDEQCKQGMDNRVGLFPAKYCTKIKGVQEKSNIEMLIRSCGMKPMDNTCGPFEFKGHNYYGCLMSCRKEACNGAVKQSSMTSYFYILMSSIFLLFGRS